MSQHYIVITGCGRLGSMLANRLSREGESVVIIDRDESTFDNLTSEFSGFTIHGDATELEVLRQAKTERADYFLAVTSNDNVNLMIAQVAKLIFGAPLVLARVFDPAREDFYAQLGINVVCPARLSADIFLQTLKAAGD
jgi:trk system potassium uptake protein TrkA